MADLFGLLIDNATKTLPPLSTTAIFAKNYLDMQKTEAPYSDKFYHANANCQSAQNCIDTRLPIFYDFVKEGWDILKKNYIKPNGLTFKENFNDSKEDLEADFYGLFKGLTNPKQDCTDLLEKYK